MAMNCNFYTFFIIKILLFCVICARDSSSAEGVVLRKVRKTMERVRRGTADSPVFAAQTQKCAHKQKLTARKRRLPAGNKLQSLQWSKIFRIARKNFVENNFFVRKKPRSRRAKMRFFFFAGCFCRNF